MDGAVAPRFSHVWGFSCVPHHGQVHMKPVQVGRVRLGSVYSEPVCNIKNCIACISKFHFSCRARSQTSRWRDMDFVFSISFIPFVAAPLCVFGGCPCERRSRNRFACSAGITGWVPAVRAAAVPWFGCLGAVGVFHLFNWRLRETAQNLTCRAMAYTWPSGILLFRLFWPTGT